MGQDALKEVRTKGEEASNIIHTAGYRAEERKRKNHQPELSAACLPSASSSKDIIPAAGNCSLCFEQEGYQELLHKGY